LPRTAVEQKKIGAPVSKAKLKPGDVLVFSIRRGWHTGIYTGGGKFVHSPSRGKRVCVEELNKKYWSERFVTGRRHKQVQ
jgi:cell wall-associated NlpC family hydrolase